MFVISIIVYFIAAVIGVVLFYLFCVWAGALIPVNTKFEAEHADKGIPIALTSNGKHIDIILPVKNHLLDWRDFLPAKDYETRLAADHHIGIGWGDKGFYLDIETWGDLSAKIAMKAFLVPSKTLMHITEHQQLPIKDAKTYADFHISEQQYLDLCSYIKSYFQTDEQGAVKHIPGVGYSPHDNFYHAHGSYHAYNTCNYWVNRGLKKIGVRTAVFAPFDPGIFSQLKKTKNEGDVRISHPLESMDTSAVAA